MNNALFILSGNLSTTPRATKTIIFAKNFFDITTIYINRSSVWLNLDKQFAKSLNINYKYTDLQNKKSFNWIIKSIIYKIINFLAKLFPKNLFLLGLCSSKAGFFIYFNNLKIKQKYQIIIAHSFGSLFAAYKLSQRHKTPFVFDVEDYHPGENCSPSEQKRREILMKKILPYAHYITYASPLIGEYTHKLIPNFPKNKMILINNCFSKNDFKLIENLSEKVQFVWFSQNIAQGRGLEYIIPILKNFQNKIHLNIIGNLYDDFYNNFLQKYISFITILPPLPPKQLNLQICNYDIGLAIEPGKDLNNKIALSNKIWAYLQAGLYIVATNTPAQTLFAKEHKLCTEIIDFNQNQTMHKIEIIINNINNIRQQKPFRYKYAQQFCWENESQKLNSIL